MRNLFHPGFIALHVLHHAAERPIYGHWMLKELARHGYRVSCGTLYPALHSLERAGLLKPGGRAPDSYRKFYVITAAGRRQLAQARAALVELAREVLPPGDRRRLAASGGHRSRRKETVRG